MRKAITLLVGSSILLLSGAALAQYPAQGGGQYGGQTGGQYGGTYQPSYQRPSQTDNVGGTDGQFVFGVDRVTGVFAHSQKFEPEGATITQSTTEIGLFGIAAANAHSTPRLTLDYFIIEGFSVGGSFIYYHRSGETETEPDAGDSVTTDDPSVQGILFEPRVGYSFVIDETFAVWPRAGITYASEKTEQTETAIPPATGDSTTTTTVNTLALTLEVPIVISPIENFAFTVGPFVDFGVSGTRSVELDPEPTGGNPDDVDTKLTSYGLSVGVVGYY